ncbi:hypothetical protein BH09MYX1_BH09MYX1_46920 [soil metagenome]
MASKKSAAHPWAFRTRFRAKAFGWKSQPAITGVREAVAEIKKVAKKSPVVAADGAVLLLERVSPALAHVDSSSGAIGSAVNRAIEDLVSISAAAPADATTREAWLERLYEARAADEVPYIEMLADCWGELCVTKDVASRWADREMGLTRRALSPDPTLRGHYHGAVACLASLYRAERYAEIVELLEPEKFWPYKRWSAKAMAAMGKKAEAIALAESSRGPWTSSGDVARICEEILLSSGLSDEAFERYAAEANGAGTYVATFRAVAKKYATKSPAEVLDRLVASTPGDEGKWFAAAKDAGLFYDAIALARRTPTDPRTLARAARDHADRQPAFALEAGLVALDWLALGYGYEVTSADVWAAYLPAKGVAERADATAALRARVRELAARYGGGKNIVAEVLRRELHDA